MSINIVKTVNFGTGKGGISTVGYRIYSSAGALSGSRVTSGVGEVRSGSGIYSGSVHISNNFTGYLLWDSGESTPIYASEDIDVISIVENTKQMTSGKWRIDSSSNQMIFYGEDNVTEISRFNLFDSSGSPSVSSVFSRVKV